MPASNCNGGPWGVLQACWILQDHLDADRPDEGHVLGYMECQILSFVPDCMVDDSIYDEALYPARKTCYSQQIFDGNSRSCRHRHTGVQDNLRTKLQ